MAHEFGHFLGLHHTFMFGCDPGDYVSDTTPIIREEGGFNVPDSCGYKGNLRDNIMDFGYTVNPLTEVYFTPGQYYRMMVNAYSRLVGTMPQFINGIVQ